MGLDFLGDVKFLFESNSSKTICADFIQQASVVQLQTQNRETAEFYQKKEREARKLKDVCKEAIIKLNISWKRGG